MAQEITEAKQCTEQQKITEKLKEQPKILTQAQQTEPLKSITEIKFDHEIEILRDKFVSLHFFGSTNIPELAEATGYLNCFFRKISFKALSLLQPVSDTLNPLDEMILEYASFIETGIANCVEQATFWTFSMIEIYLKTKNPDFIPAQVVFSDKAGELLHRYTIAYANRYKDGSIAKDFFKEETIAFDTWLGNITDALEHAEVVQSHFPTINSFVVYDMLKHIKEFQTIQERVLKARSSFSKVFTLCLNEASIADSEFPLDIEKGKKYLINCLEQALREENPEKIERIRRYVNFLDLSPIPAKRTKFKS